MNATRRYVWIALVLGVWEIAAPYLLSYRGVALVIDGAVGLAVLLLSLWALARWPRSQLLPRWLTVVAGAILVFAPFVARYAHDRTALANDVVVGIAIVAVAGYGALAAGQRRQGRPVEERGPEAPRDELRSSDRDALPTTDTDDAPDQEWERRDDEDVDAA